MDCRHVEELISAYADGELDKVEAGEVSRHLTGCACCQASYALTMQLAEACRQIGQTVVPAPMGFANVLMQRIREEEAAVAVPRIPWYYRHWKQAAAGIAAGLLLVWGAVGINLAPVADIAQNPAAIVQPDPGNPVADNPTGNQNSDISGNQGSAPETTSPDSVRNSVTPGATDPVQYVNHDLPGQVLLNKERSIVSTLLQVKVNNSAYALQQALNMAAQAKASTQDLGQQIDQNGSYTTLKITVAKSAAGNLINQLSSLGVVTNKEVTKNDITTHYAETLSEYQILAAQRATLQDGNQIADLDQRLNNLESQMMNWEEQAEQETILLWLYQ